MFELNEDGTSRRLISVEEEQEMLIKKKLRNAKEEGFKIGFKKESKEIALRMLKGNMPIEDIIKYTSLTKEEIENIQAQNR